MSDAGANEISAAVLIVGSAMTAAILKVFNKGCLFRSPCGAHDCICATGQHTENEVLQNNQDDHNDHDDSIIDIV